eukprot:8204772-Pyramimonas_sp.AAC.2
MHAPGCKITCYTAHLEVFCGTLARIAQFSEILSDSREQVLNTRSSSLCRQWNGQLKPTLHPRAPYNATAARERRRMHVCVT